MKDDAHDRSQRDEELAALLNQLTEPRSKTRPSLETLTAEYPHLADELRELWGTVMVVDAVAQRPHPIDGKTQGTHDAPAA